MTHTFEQRRKCVLREIALREQTYPKQVARKKMRQAEADYELGCMKAILGMIQFLQGEGIPDPMPRPADMIAALVHIRTITNLEDESATAFAVALAEIRKVVEDVLTGIPLPKLEEGT